MATVIGLVLWRGHRRAGCILIGLGVLPGCAALVLFWNPLFLALGLVSMSVLVAAIDDLEHARHAAPPPRSID